MVLSPSWFNNTLQSVFCLVYLEESKQGEAWTDSTVNDLVAGREWCRGREIEREKGAGQNGKKLRRSERVSVYVCVSARERASEEMCEAYALCRFLSQSQTASCGAGTVTSVLVFSITLSVVLHWPRNPSPGEPDLLFPSSSRRNGLSKGVIEQQTQRRYEVYTECLQERR